MMFVLRETVDTKLQQTGFLHLQAEAFQRLVKLVSVDVGKE